MSKDLRLNSTDIFQIIAPDGSYNQALDPELGEDLLRKMYRGMMLTRIVDTRAVILQRQGRVGFYVPTTGEEASQIGSACALDPTDWIVAAYREVGAALLRGMPLERMFNQALGNDRDLLKGRQMPSHFGDRAANFVPASSPVGTQIPIAVGVAWAAKIRKEPMVAMVYFGDGSTSQGDFHTGLNFAGVYGVPVIFFCKNNHWAISCPFSKQTAAACIAVRAAGYGIEGWRVDGNDVLAVYSVTRQAVEKARNGGGPTLIESVTYRMGPHSTSDDPRRYRDDSEVEPWKAKDPIVRFRKYLESKGVWSEADEERLTKEIEDEIEAAVSVAESASVPPLETLFDDVYETQTWNLKEQLEGAKRKALSVQ